MKKWKLMILLGAVILCQIPLGGCRLAKQDKTAQTQSSKRQDRLVGVFVTAENVFATDEDQMADEMREQLVKQEDGDTIEVEDEKLYAKKELKKDENGNENTWYTFSVSNGIGMYTWVATQENEPVRYNYEPEGMTYIPDFRVNYGYAEDEYTTNCTGTIYVDKNYLKEKGEMNVYIYPVFQEHYGDVYLSSDAKVISMNGDVEVEQTHSQKETVDITENGETKKETFEVNLTFKQASPADKTALLFLDDTMEVAELKTYENAEIPDTIKVKKKYQNMIVKSIAGGKVSDRKLVALSEDAEETIQMQGDIPGFLGGKIVNFERE